MEKKRTISPETLAKMLETRHLNRSEIKSHTVRAKNGGTVLVSDYTRSLAIALMCTECMGFEASPNDCSSPLCPLFPFRKNSRITRT